MAGMGGKRNGIVTRENTIPRTTITMEDRKKCVHVYNRLVIWDFCCNSRITSVILRNWKTFCLS